MMTLKTFFNTLTSLPPEEQVEFNCFEKDGGEMDCSWRTPSGNCPVAAVFNFKLNLDAFHKADRLVEEGDQITYWADSGKWRI